MADEKYRSEYSGQELDDYITRFKNITASSSEINVLAGIQGVTVADLNKISGISKITTDISRIELLNDWDISQTVKEALKLKKDKADFILKGSESIPIYFDKYGEAKEVTYFRGKADLAECANCDKDGNEISSTYLKNSHKNREEAILYANKWSGNKYSFEDIYDSSIWALQIELSSLASAEELKAYGKAGLAGSIEKNIITAIKKVPEIDIHIILNKEKLV